MNKTEIDEKLAELASHLRAALEVCEELQAVEINRKLHAYLGRTKGLLSRLVTYVGQFDARAIEVMRTPLHEFLGQELFGHLREKHAEHLREWDKRPKDKYHSIPPVAKKHMFLGDLIECDDDGWRCYKMTAATWWHTEGECWDWKKTECGACEAIRAKVSGVDIQTGKDSPFNWRRQR